MTLAWPLSVPVLTDGVVTLRAHVRADVDAMLEMAQDPEMVRWTSVPEEQTRAGTEEFAFAVIPKGWDQGTNRCWAIEADGGYVGNVDVRGMPIADIGFALHPSARGRGLMVRAVRLATDWAFTHGGVEIVHWRAHVGNVASLRVAHRTGFTLHGITPGILHERGQVIDAWTASRRFGDAPLPDVPWAEATALETERLRLRPLRDDDTPRIVEACSDPASRQWLRNLPHPYTTESAREFLHDVSWREARGTKITWAVADRADDQLLGTVALMKLHSPTDAEVGYWMHPDARGRGIMTEAVRAVVQHAFDPAGLDRHRVSLHAAATNAASNGVAVAAGFRLVGTETAAEQLGDGTFDDLNTYEVLRP
ncbi:GNAT family N-acetyltransferase [Aeromicrobium terrae]|uniref:GNAT family N-acetyltransferase n=1 Tax=Aeromicrobium terrae TaxID=2498846 RepID=A0A5C8NEI5_9ACTN|nr:GNAT family N-acetyltransferase [Aeromicrobium terrae]TXL57283.1 GNAT family N-acetyltransferase [Aeromicrobium terrae]